MQSVTLANDFGAVLLGYLQARKIVIPKSIQGTFSLVRGQPRSLIGSQNELIRCGLHLFEKPDATLEGICEQLNHTPMSAIEDIFPDDAFLKALVSAPPFPPPSGGTDNIVPFPSLN